MEAMRLSWIVDQNVDQNAGRVVGSLNVTISDDSRLTGDTGKQSKLLFRLFKRQSHL